MHYLVRFREKRYSNYNLDNICAPNAASLITLHSGILCLLFISGAVSMATLPPASHPEVAFIGRSNVGKSSLINMLANKKKYVTY